MAKSQAKTTAHSDPVSRLMALFPGNQRASGRFDPKRDRNFTEDQPIRPADWEAHLVGAMGCGVIPIQDDDTCQFAGIDIDNHGSDEDLPIHEVEALAREKKLPLVMCRSKSGGIHAYLFLEKPNSCGKIQTILGKWAEYLGYPKAEIFPKQARLVAKGDAPRPTGNYLNMPYMGNGSTMRYCVHEGKKLDLNQFLDLAEKMRMSDAGLRTQVATEHPDAPPCMQRVFANGVAQGQRNEAFYNSVVYFKKMDPEGYEKRALELNQSLFAKPLPRTEMLRTLQSAGRPECTYRCNEEPLKTLCDREACLKRKFGITPADADRLATADALPGFSDLTKYLSEPVRWEMKIGGVKVTNIGTEMLMDWRAMRIMIADRLTMVVPQIKPQEWERILIPLMKEVRIIDAPDDASVAGVIRDRLREFAAKTDLTNRGEDTDDRKAWLRGLPAVQRYEGERHVFFRGQDFVNYLKRTKSEELKGINLWFAVKDIGVQHTKLRAGDHNINVWYIPVKQVLESQMRPQGPEYKSEL